MYNVTTHELLQIFIASGRCGGGTMTLGSLWNKFGHARPIYELQEGLRSGVEQGWFELEHQRDLVRLTSAGFAEAQSSR